MTTTKPNRHVFARRNLFKVGAASAVLAGASIAAPAFAAMATSGGDALALSLFRQWIAAANEYDRQYAAAPDDADCPAGDLMTEIEDRILEISGGAVALALKTYFRVRQDHASWVPEARFCAFRRRSPMAPIGMSKLRWRCCAMPLPLSRRPSNRPLRCCT
jgi:hypothetical protein